MGGRYHEALRLMTEAEESLPDLLPARQVPCCGSALPPAEEVIEAPFDPDETVWLCVCGNNESASHRFCSRCGRRMGVSEPALRHDEENG